MPKHQGTPPPQAVIYARVSSKEQEKEGFSIPAQLKLLRQYATEQGFPVIQEYVDVETAKRAGRTGFTEMVGFFKKQMKGKISTATRRILLVEKTDRLYRISGEDG
jgi:DNA invertase Pin-like site-specific DNA recombinase